MIATAIILNEFIDDVVREVQDNMNAEGVNATGETLRSFEKEVSQSRALLYAAKHIGVLEDGRKPTAFGPHQQGPTLKSIIRKWIDAKGIDPGTDKNGRPVTKDSLAFLISRKIHKEGTKLYREGGNSGILSGVITPERVNELGQRIGDEYFKAISNVVRSI